MAPKFSKGERVRVLATTFDNENRDNAGMNFSERWLADGHGTWCYGTICRVYVKKGRMPQKYSVKYDIGGQWHVKKTTLRMLGLRRVIQTSP
jgi:hypothetical protein